MSASGRRPLSVVDGVTVVVGIVLGVGIFRVPGTVAAMAGGEGALYVLWIAGGVAALVGALCYAELASAWPSSGGEYTFLARAFGRRLGLLFVWARATVIQSGAIAAVAFVFGDYTAGLVGAPSELPAAAAVVAATAVNLTGWTPGALAQRTLTGATVAAMVGLAAVALAAEPAPAAALPTAAPTGSAGTAMVFVMLAYGGWNEAAYLGGDLRQSPWGMVVVLAAGLAVVAAVYLLLNYAYLSVLGLEGMRGSQAVAADAMRRAAGDEGAVTVSLVIAVAALSTLNATIITGAGAIRALGRDVAALAPLARRRTAILVQGGWVLVLIALAALARDGFAAMIEYTAPVFWLFLLLVGVAVFVLRRRPPEGAATFRVPFYPLPPLLFCATSAFMLQASLAYVGASGWVGLAVLATGVPFVLWASKRTSRH